MKVGNLVAALKNYSEAIALDPEDALLYSNRSAVFCGLNRFDQALDDAEVAIKLKPNWAKVEVLFLYCRFAVYFTGILLSRVVLAYMFIKLMEHY